MLTIPQNQVVYKFKFKFFKELAAVFEKNIPPSVIIERRYSVEYVGKKYQITILLTAEERKDLLEKFRADMARIEQNTKETQQNEYIPSFLPQPENFSNILIKKDRE